MSNIDTLRLFIENAPAAVENLEANPEKYRAMNPDNGWGDYDRLCTLWREILPRAKAIAEAVPNATWWEWS